MAFKPFPSGHDLASADVNDLVGVGDRSSSVVDVAGDVQGTTETALWSKVLAGNYLSTDRTLVVVITGDFLNSSGGGLTVRFRFKLGATTMVDTGAIAIASNAARQPLRIEFDLTNLGATNSQELEGYIGLSKNSSGAAFTTGLGNATTQDPTWRFEGVAAEDTTSAKTLQVTVELGSTSASLSCRKKKARAWLG